MSTEPRTAVVNVFVTRPLEIDEPDWCAGHPDDRAQYKVDITHFGPEHVLEANGIQTLRAIIASSPFSQHTPGPVLYVENGELTGSYTPDEVEELADALVQSADQLRTLGRQLADILAGGGQ
ncbi:DUF6907 domain-containing protein [Streptomyces griseorubiginosus]|uniref:DUF6907 domain-containing protein n=1 Tax=Streptomyces griseorubiginosus TaxID=67304 RepID=UPI002E7FB9DB|nr:hypothetical protein [Streptomyces griseorubiginosus]WUB45308.1 hypothetical protein OHN19_18935 [Streptomyces griseorubiginosus]WUB53825.1 hypothetical protein OG942_18930 [Streptomyces griseorubiginosus]